MAAKSKERPLTAKQEAFCREYLIDLCAADAARRAGYAPAYADRQGYQQLENPRVQKRLKELMDKRASKTEIDAEYVLKKIKATIEDAAQKVPVGEGGAEAMLNHSAALKGLELLGKHLVLFSDKVDVTSGGKALDNVFTINPVAKK